MLAGVGGATVMLMGIILIIKLTQSDLTSREIREETRQGNAAQNENAPVVGTWDGNFPDGTTWMFTFRQDHTVHGDNGFKGSWDQFGLKVIAINDEEPPPGESRKWEGDIDRSGKVMKLENIRRGLVTYVRRE
jgi:hypothetical protein